MTINCSIPKIKSTKLSQQIYIILRRTFGVLGFTVRRVFIPQNCTFTLCTSAFIHLSTNLFLAYLTTLLVAGLYNAEWMDVEQTI
jgi:hypothetical protein